MRFDFFKKYIFILIIFIFACSDDSGVNRMVDNPGDENIYNNNTNLQKIIEYENEKNSEELIKIIMQDNSEYKVQALYSLASICDTNCLLSVNVVLEDADAEVRQVAAYTLGRIGSVKSENKLINTFSNETNLNVKKELLIAIGKCGTDKSLNFVSQLETEQQPIEVQEGQAKALFFMANKGLISQQSTDKVVYELQNVKLKQDIKLAFSYFLTVNNDIKIESLLPYIKYEFENNNDVVFLSNLINGIKHIKTPEALVFLKTIINGNYDYRIKINAINALYPHNYEVVKDIIFTSLLSENAKISITASKYLLQNGTGYDANKYMKLADRITSFQARNNVYKAALYFATNKKEITDKIMSGYNVTNNVYEKAGLLYALSADPSMYKFVKDETFSTQSNVVSTEGIRALYFMRLHPNFNKIAWRLKDKNGEDLHLEFKLIFKEAMASKNSSMIYYATKIMSKFGDEYFDEFTNTYFMSQALNSLVMPRDMKLYNDLCSLINKYGAKNCIYHEFTNNVKLDWDYISSIPGNQKVLVQTNKGEFEILLDVNSCPITVSNFLLLTKKNYYSNIYFYKNYPEQAIFSGSKRGDGWSNINFVSSYEFRNKNFYNGSVVMNKNYGNFQTCNWFISTTQAIETPNRYAVFGQVIIGLDVVQSLEVGDYILEVKIM